MFEKLPLKVLKTIIKSYQLETKIELSKLIDGRRVKLTKSELAKELHKHLEITENGDIKYKEKDFNFPKVKFPEEKVIKKSQKKSKTNIDKIKETKPKVISDTDIFVIYDSKGRDETLDLTNIYELQNVKVYNYNSIDNLLTEEGSVILMTWEYMTKQYPVDEFTDYITDLEDNDIERYEEIKESVFPKDKNRHIQVFIKSQTDTLIGFIRTIIEKDNLHIDFVFVNPEYQGNGYVGEMFSLLFEYLMKKNLLKSINSVDLEYYADSYSGWFAYDKGIKRYGFTNPYLKYKDSDLKDLNFIKDIHNKFERETMLWEKNVKGSGMKIKPVEDIELKL
jgi:ribosomal protein S18 acetylase RimI-like enzyme